MNMMCCICQSGSVEPYSDLSWEISSHTYQLVTCASCGTAYTDPIPDKETIDHLYKTGFNYNWYRDHLWAKLKDCRIRIDEYAPHLGEKVLDYGGGIGYFSQVARERGYKSLTYDPYASNGQLEHDQWDTVVCSHMLEHSNDPDATIREVKGMLSKGGKLILTVPNFSSSGYRQLGMEWVWAQPPLLHIFHFTSEGLISLLKRNGLEIISVSFHERWDANLQSDLKEVHKFKKLDSLWHKQPYSKFRFYQKFIATINSLIRFNALKKALVNYDSNNKIYSELSIICGNK